GEWAAEWLKTYKSALREHTKMSYLNSYNNHIAPVLERLPLKSVLPVHIKAVMNNVANYSEDLQRKVLNTMKQIFETAMQNHLISVNPCNGMKITPRDSDERIKFLTPAQQRKLLEAVTEPRARAFVALGLYCGLRREESLGLMWSDIKGSKLTVNRAVTFLKNQQDPDHSLKSKAAHRTIPIPKPLLEILKETPREGLYIITAAHGREMTLMAYRRMWEYVTKSVKFDVHSHMLRHTYATSLYRAGIDLKTAQYLLGHSDIKMTAEIYTHIEQGKMKSSAIKINQLFEQDKSGSQKGSQKVKKA
ncbi:MAG: site-specific integrase, partial [Ruminococcaceae bacterium]|nr:site-specific integrase [Oscillospiraceae bacterium]